MEIKFKVILNIPTESINALGITEDTLFKTTIEDGKLILEMLEDEDFDDDDDFEECECGCDNCEHFCHRFHLGWSHHGRNRR